MGITVNNSHYNMSTLAGLCVEYLDGHEPQTKLYVYGLGGGGTYDFYIDPLLPMCKEICNFLYSMGVTVCVGLETTPKFRPAIGVTRRAREDFIEFSAKVCTFILLCVEYGFVLPPLHPTMEALDIGQEAYAFNQMLKNTYRNEV